jgi:hypothetical protein
MRRKNAYLSGAVLLAALCISLLSAGAARAAIVIDDFANTNPGGMMGVPVVLEDSMNAGTGVTLLETGLPDSSTGGGGVFGGSRHSNVNAISNATPGLFGSELIIVPNVNSGVAVMNNDSGLMGGVLGDFTFTWDARTMAGTPGPGANGGMGVDITQGGMNTGLGIEFIFSDIGADAEFFLTDMNDSVSSLLKTTSGAGSLFFDYDDFVGSADLTSIKGVRLELGGAAGADFTIDLISSRSDIPEPATAGLLILGGAALLRRRRLLA